MDDKVSVIITTFNRDEDVIDRAIKTVKNQTYSNLEIIIVDDNGEKHPDISEKVKKCALRYEDVVYIRHAKNKGACAARNTGIKAAKGSFLAFLDDDDTWVKDKIALQMNKFSDDVGFVYCGMNVVYENNGKKERWEATEKKNRVVALLKKNYVGNTSCGVVRKTIAEKVHGFDEKLKSGQDQDFWIRLAQVCEFAYVNECLVNYTFLSKGSITKNQKIKLESNLYLYNKYKDIIKSDWSLFVLFNMKIMKCRVVNLIHKKNEK